MESRNLENKFFTITLATLAIFILGTVFSTKPNIPAVELNTTAQVSEMHSVAQTEQPMQVVVIVGKRLPKTES